MPGLQGIVLKMDVGMGTMKIKLIRAKFEENPVIPASKFEIPKDIKVTEN